MTMMINDGIISNISSESTYWNSWKTGKNPVMDSWPFMSDPTLVTGITAFYLLFVLWLGPTIMRKRSPMKLTNVMILYNASQVILSSTNLYKATKLNLFIDGIGSAGCGYSSNALDMRLADVAWYFAIAKITELLDTVFFVLRKKHKQISFLHVYHHTMMVGYCWVAAKFAYSGQGAIIGVLNSVVHVVMYSYYLLSAMGPAVEKYLWWKKYLTAFQITQFVIIVVYIIIMELNPACDFNKNYTYFLFLNIVLFFALFLKFFFKSYGNDSKFRVRKEAKSEKRNKRNINEINGRDSNGISKINENDESLENSYNQQPVLCHIQPIMLKENEKKFS